MLLQPVCKHLIGKLFIYKGNDNLLDLVDFVFNANSVDLKQDKHTMETGSLVAVDKAMIARNCIT